MKNNFVRRLCGLLATAMLTTIIGGCGKTDTDAPNATNSTATEQAAEQAAEQATEQATESATEASTEAELSEEELALAAQREEALRLNGNSKNYSFDSIEKLEGNPLEGKTICVLGSSVTDGYSSGHYAVGEYFEARFGCNLIKEAVSGTTLTNLYNDSYLSRMVNNIDATEIDLLIVQLSTNDASLNFPLGEVIESTNPGNFNQRTIIGSMECIIGYAQHTWNCPVVFYTGSYYENAAYENMVNALPALQEKWGIGVIDLYHNEEFNDITDEMRSIYMSDDIHPNKAGYRDWWGPEMEKQLLEFLEEQQ